MSHNSATAKLRLASFLFPGGHLGAWRLPDARPEIDMTFAEYVRLARLSEQGKMDALFFQDTATVPRSNDLLRGDYQGGISPRAVYLEPMTLLPALATVTRHIGLMATASTTFNEPYNIARKFATLDHISGGRAGWNLVTSQNENEARNFGLEQHVEHGQRYARAAEFFDVVTGLWDSWEAGSITRDKTSGRYFDVGKLHIADHRGEFFQVRGPLNVDRSPQVYPVIAQAGSSEPGRELAARTADVVFTAQTTIAEGQAFCADVKGRAVRYGRAPEDIKVLPGLKTVVGRTEAEAFALRDRMLELIPDDLALTHMMQISGGLDLRKYPLDGPLPDLPPTNSAKARQQLMMDLARRENLTLLQISQVYAESAGHLTMAGTPARIADEMEAWFRQGACDGFVVQYPYYPKPVEDFVTLVIPELQRRGLFRTEYEGTTLRENLGVPPRGRGSRS